MKQVVKRQQSKRNTILRRKVLQSARKLLKKLRGLFKFTICRIFLESLFEYIKEKWMCLAIACKLVAGSNKVCDLHLHIRCSSELIQNI